MSIFKQRSPLRTQRKGRPGIVGSIGIGAGALAVIALCGGATAWAISNASTSTISVCATATVPANTISGNGVVIGTISATSTVKCATSTYTIPTSTVGATTTASSSTATSSTSAPDPPAPPGPTVTLNGSQTASLDGNRYILQGNEWNSGAALGVTENGNVDFTVGANSINDAYPGNPGAYPSLYAGCHWGNCTTGSGLPLQVSQVAKPGTVLTSDNTTTPSSGGIWDDAYDIWFNGDATAAADNQSPWLEMMVWLNTSATDPDSLPLVAPNVSLDGLVWNVHEGGSEVIYELAKHQDSVTGLDLAPLAQDSVNRGYMSANDYLLDVEAGFEIWNGAAGNSINSFSVNVN